MDHESKTGQSRYDGLSLPDYPSSSTIPFPISSGPYPCQAALMDAMLQTLQLVDEEDFNGTTVKMDVNSKGSNVVDISSGNNYGTQPNRRRANIMMLESPTGTGKSLSLACASLAWLKYRQVVDLRLLEHEINLQKQNNLSSKVSDPKEGNCDGKCTYETTKEAKKESSMSRNWLDAWAPQDQIAKIEEENKRNEACLDLATGTRAALEKELNLIRKEVKRTVRQENHLSEIKSKQEIMRRVRAQIVKKSVVGARSRSWSKYELEGTASRKRHWSESRGGDCEQENNYCLDAYHSDDDIANNASKYHYSSSDDDEGDHQRHMAQYMSPNKRETLLADVINGGKLDGSGASINRRRPGDENLMTIGGIVPGRGIRKIIYAARTHSQLSQFVGEIRRTFWGDNVRVITLGGRKLLCGNQDVTNNGKSSEAMITERCLDIQKEKKSSCPLLKKDILPTLSLHMLAHPSDIEDMAGLGEASKTCSYYASREALMAAEVVVAPYNTILSKSTREAIGLSLKKALVVIDEGHNVPEALRSLSSCKLTLQIIDRAMIQLKNYVSKYATRLAGRNIFYLGQIRRFLTAAAKYLRSGGRTNRKTKTKNDMVTATELLFTLKIDNLNLFNILRYLEKSRLSQKLHGFAKSSQHEIQEMNTDEGRDSNFVSKHVSAMSIVESFLRCLTSTQKEGRVVIEIPKTEETPGNELRSSTEAAACFRYLLLDPSVEFDNVLDEAHAVVLAGGTLRPFTHVATELFGKEKDLVEQADKAERNIDPNDKTSSQAHVTPSLTSFTCGHVVPSKNVFLTCLSKGPAAGALDFRHSSRYQHSTYSELGRAILSICDIVPNGVVVFLPSYSYESFLMNKWENENAGILDLIKAKKYIYREPKSTANVQQTLDSYSKKAFSKQGAILFCVVGGKMSEGINFANEMARGVVVVGLPYADITDIVLKTKMDILDKDYKEKRASITGSEYYQALCMRNVNQSIGRAIRHAKDYAAIILADVRYESDPKVWRDLPAWLRPDRKSTDPFDIQMRSIRSFFDNVLTC